MSELPERVQRWRQTREMGRQRYIHRYGVGFWGMTVAILWTIAFSYTAVPQPPLLIVAPIALVGFGAAGYVWGAFMWMLSERWYFAELKKHRKSTQRDRRRESAARAIVEQCRG